MNPRARRLRRLRRKTRASADQLWIVRRAEYDAALARARLAAARKQKRLTDQAARKAAELSGGARLAAMLSGIPKP